MENYKTFLPKSGCRRLQEMVVNMRGFNYKALTEQFFGILDWCWLIVAGRLPCSTSCGHTLRFLCSF